MIDDGGHTMKQQLVTFATLLPHVKPGGLYIVEDQAPPTLVRISHINRHLQHWFVDKGIKWTSVVHQEHKHCALTFNQYLSNKIFFLAYFNFAPISEFVYTRGLGLVITNVNLTIPPPLLIGNVHGVCVVL